MAVDVASLVIRVSSLEAQSAARDLDRLSAASGHADRSARQMSGGFASVGSALKGMVAQLAAVAGVTAITSGFVSANLEMQRLAKGLTAVTGSAELAGKEIEYLKVQADRMGTSLGSLGNAYVSLTAATKGTAMEGQATRAIFESISLAMGKLGKSSADTEGALMAIQQMISKGTVSSEELKQQLGERLPGAFRLAAEAIGVTEQQLGKMLEQGQVVATDLLPKLSQKLLKLYDDGTRIGGMGAEWERVKNAANAFFVELDKGTGITGAIATLLSDVAAAFKGMTTSLAESAGSTGIFATTMASLGETIKTTRAELISGEWSESTTLIMAIAGAAAGMAAIMVTLSGAIGVVNVAMGILTGILALNPFTAIILAIGATAGALYALSEQTVTVGDTTATVGSMVQAAWEITATNSVAAWEVFTGWIMSAFDNVPSVVSAAGSAIVASWSSAMSGLMELTSGAVNFIMNSFKTVGTALGVIAGEIAMTFETGFNFERLKQGLADSVSSTDQLGEANNRIQSVIKNTGTAFKAKTQAIESDRLEEQLAVVVTGEHARQQLNLSNKLTGGIAPAKALASAIGAGAAAHKGAAKAANEQEKALDALIKKYLPARDDAKNLEEATAVLEKAMQDGKITGEEYGKMLKGLKKDYNTAENAAQALIDKYDTEGARTRQLAEDRALMTANMADGNLKLEGAAAAMDKLTEAEKKNTKEADAWAEVWKNAVKRIDDTFASLWKDLFSGTKSTLESMKNAILSWLAEVAHALLTKPLVVAITTAMTGGTSVAGAAGQAASGVSGLGSFSSIGSMFSTAFQLGSTFLSGVAEGVMGMFSTNMFSTIGTAWGAATSGSAMGAAAGMGVMAAYALPVVAAAVAVFSKWQSDQKPRYGAYSAATGGRQRGLEDWENGPDNYSKGAFGLTFGISDKGSKNMDASEMKELFDGFAKVSQALASFYGNDVSAKIEASLTARGDIMRLAMDANEAFDVMFTTILDLGAATGDELAVVFKAVVGDLTGTAEEMANQLAAGMQNALMLVQVAGQMKGTEMGDKLGLAGTDEAAAMQLIDYAKAMKTSGEAIGTTIQRLVLNTATFDAALTLTGTTTEATGMAFIEMANGLATAADAAKIGMGGLMQLQGAYYEHFYTKEEQALKQKENAIQAITRWNEDAGRTGDAAITTSAQFRAYVESLDLSTTAGQEAYVAAMKMVGGFISLDDALLKLGEGTGAVVASWAAQKDELLKLSQAFDDSGSKNAYQQGKDALKKAGYYELNTGEGQEYSYDPKYIAEFLKQLSELEDGGGEAGTELLKLKDVLLQMAEVARQKADLENQILAFTDPGAALAASRKLELEAMDESLRPLQERLWALQDEAKALQANTDLMDWVTNGAYSQAQAMAHVTQAFANMGIEMPATKAALDALIQSGKLSAEQIAILAAILGDLKIVYPDNTNSKTDNYQTQVQQGGGGGTSERKSKLPELELELLKLQEGAWAATLKQRELELKALTAAEAVLQKQIWALEDANRVRDLEIQLLQTQGKTWQATLILRELELKDLSDAEKALMKLIWAQEDANRIRDLEIQLMELQGKSWQATLARRALELKGMSEAEKAIMKLIWAQEDANRIRDLEIRLMEAQGKSWQATLAKRQLELKGLSDEEKALMKLIWAQEDANRIRDLETQLLEAQGKSWQATLAKRRLELKGLSDEEKALMKLIWAQEDANRIRDLETQLLEAQGKSWQATLANRKLELIGLSKEEQALMKLIWAQEDANRIRDLEIRLLEAQGRTWAATIKQRNLELIGLSKEEKALMRLIWAQEDASRRRELELRLMEAQGNTWKVTIARRNEELKGLSKEEQALMKLIWAQEDANRVRDLELRLMELQGRGQEALQIKRAIELLAMSKAEQAIQKQIWALEDEAAIREEHLSLYIRLAEVMGDDYLALQIKRQMELRDVSNSASRALLLMIYGLEDKKKAEEEAQAIKDKAAEEANRLAIEALEKIVNALSQLSDAIQSTIENLFPQAQVDIIMRRELAEAKIRAAVLAARAGTMPTLESLEPALNAVGKTEDVQFQTREAYLRRMGQTKADLLELGTFVQDKLTIEEQMLEELKKIPEETGASVGNEVNPEVLKLINLSNLMIDSLAAIDTNFDDKLTAAELIAALGSVASEESLLAYFATLDTNHNGLISALESLPLSIALSLKPMFTSLDTNLDKNLSFEELQAGLGAIMTGPQITAMMALMDTDKNGVISELEASSFSLNEINSKSLELQALSDIKTNISGTNTKLATVATKIVDVSANIIKTNQLLGYTENVTPPGVLLSTPLLNVSANTNALVTDNSDIKTKLGTILNGTNNLRSIDTKLTTVNASINAVTAKLTTIDSRLPSIATNTNHLSAIATNTASIATNTAGYSAKSLARIVDDIYWMLNAWKSSAGYATGGIASGPTSGYQATLHGTEAIIPLGDGNSVTAHLTAPLPNYIAQEAGDGPELRQALAELQAEIAALRGDQRAIGAATVGELKDHNKRERKRDVVPQVVEIAP